jgi:dihydrofolate synthase/folylpolyglutamate synthase
MADESAFAISNRDAAEAFLEDRIGHGVKPGLDRIAGLLEYMGDPQSLFPTVHIAGTNGKTTVAGMIQQILGAHGLSTAGFTSPHLGVVEERFTLHGAPIDADRFTETVRDIAWFVAKYEEDHRESITYFEATMALAMSLMAAEAVDVGVIEVGLGGRLDATNALNADVSVVTGIDIDHAEFLGSTIEQITREKVAIVKANGTLVTGKLPEESLRPIADRVSETRSRWIRFGQDFEVRDAAVGVGGWQCHVEGVFDEYPDLFLPLHGRHQVDNLATAIAASEMFLGRPLDPDLLLVAVASMRSPGRLEVVARRPIVLLDGAHNPQGFRGLANTLDGEFPTLPWDLVIAVRGERSVADLVAPLEGRVRRVFATQVGDAASRAAAEVAADAGAVLEVEAESFEDPESALDAARRAAGPDGGVIVAGSLYLVGELRSRFEVRDAGPVEAHLRFEAERADFDEYDLESDDADDLEDPDGLSEEEGEPLG